MSSFFCLFKVCFLSIVRDKVLRVVFLSGLFFTLLAPFLSMLSMRQMQQLMITVSLSWISLTLLVLALILGSSSIWRDIERRWLFAVFGMPVSRGTYVQARISAIFISLFAAGLFLGIIGGVLISLAGSKFSTAFDFTWANYFYAVLFDIAKYMLLAAIATCFSTVSTSLFLPLFAGISVFVAGSASQGVIDYLTSTTQPISVTTLFIAKSIYYLLPNFSLFDLSTQAVYGLAVTPSQLIWGGAYFLVYTGIVICFAVLSLNRRELN